MNILKVNGKEYILKYNFRALSELQERGINFFDEYEFRLKDIVTLLHVGMNKFHKDMTVDTVYDLMDDILAEMSMEDLMTLVGKAMEDSMGKPQPSPTK